MPKTRELSAHERAQIFRRRQKGETLQKIATDFGISPEGVRRIVQKVIKTGSPETQPRSGRKRKTTSRQDRQIIAEVRKNPFISVRQIQEVLSLPIKTTQIKSRLYEANLHGRVSRKRPFISVVNAKKRLQFANAHINKPQSFWNSVLWSDESKFELRSNKRRQYVWRTPGQAFNPKLILPTVKHGGGAIMIWGCFSGFGVGKLHFIEGKLTGERYVDILRENLVSSAQELGMEESFIFMQDNDPKHTSRVSRNFLTENRIELLPWPPQSPDLNPIEHLWDELDRRIPTAQRNTKKSFEEALRREWQNITPEVIQKLIRSIPHRLREVITAKGYQTSY